MRNITIIIVRYFMNRDILYLLYYQCCDKTKIKSLYLQQTYDNYYNFK